MKLYAVKYAESVFGENHIFKGGDPEVLLPIHFVIFLIEDEARRILIDAGCDTMPGWDMRHFESPSVILERAGIPCDSITDVVLTHFHHDHVEAVKYFKNAVAHIQKDEYELCKGYFPEGMKIETFTDEKELPSGIKAIKIGAHSVGSCIVEFPLGNKTGVISGDEVYSKKVIDIAKNGNGYHPRTVEFAKKYSDSEKYKVFVMHEPEYLDGTNGVMLIYDSNEKL